MSEPLCASLREKIDEQLERTIHLTRLLPETCVETLLGHLLDCAAGVCAVLAAAQPERLAHFAALRGLPVNHACAPGETVERMGVYRAHIEEGFAALHDDDLSRRTPTVFVRTGETVLTLLLGNLEHLINHKHQLFLYVRSMGRAVETRDLYRFR
jgi:hypothetical protein